MQVEPKKMKPIWYFVGLMLLSMGVVVLFSGIYDLLSPPLSRTMLAELHPGLWWGLMMVAAGVVALITTRASHRQE